MPVRAPCANPGEQHILRRRSALPQLWLMRTSHRLHMTAMKLPVRSSATQRRVPLTRDGLCKLEVELAGKERRATLAANPIDGSGAEFGERRREHLYEQLRGRWTACPQCKGPNLIRPSLAVYGRIPEATATCAACGAPFASDTLGHLRLLVSRRPPTGVGR